MADVLNRTTKQYLTSVNTPDYPTVDWIIEPDLSAVAGFPNIYWIITGDNVTLMDPAARAVVDQQIADALQVDRRTAITDEVDDPVSRGIRLRALIELFNKRDNYLTNRITEIQTALTNIRDQVLGTQARQNIPGSFPLATSTRPRSDAVQDFKDNITAGGSDT